ncbi:carbon-nitrogen hydrolase family protein [Rhizobiaceae bacterium n13]|nr:carbon-nitrogen hydrolase family protein [Fererhizobium litorale]MDI7865024.1 carbon-nitrogen hydrolase family protein [Fererhizobium litorale]
MTRIAIVEWEDGLLPGTEAWSRIRALVDDLHPDILVTNEMPFGNWLPRVKGFDPEQAQAWARLHDTALDELAALNATTIVSSRPVMHPDALANEAFLLERGTYRFLHHKHLFPAEPNWEEASWFKPFHSGFDPLAAGKTTIGALLCTELMFPRCAKLLGQRGAEVIAAPRATGGNSVLWHAASVIAAASAGAYVVSSNRTRNPASPDSIFGGGGFATDPHGRLIGTTSEENPVVVIEIDESIARAAKSEYPHYVSEEYLGGQFPGAD